MSNEYDIPQRRALNSGREHGYAGHYHSRAGPTLPNLASNTASSLATIGAIFSAIFLGGLITQLGGGPLNNRVGQRPVMLTGIVLMALGACGIASSHALPLMLACAVVMGMGRGAISISAHLLIARVFAARSAAALNILNVFYGVGAVAAPAIAGLALRTWGSALLVLWIGAALLLAQVPLILRLAPLPRLGRHREAGEREASPLRSALLWICGALLLIYVGSETGVGGWTPTYLARTTALGTATASQSLIVVQLPAHSRLFGQRLGPLPRSWSGGDRNCRRTWNPLSRGRPRPGCSWRKATLFPTAAGTLCSHRRRRVQRHQANRRGPSSSRYSESYLVIWRAHEKSCAMPFCTSRRHAPF